MVNVRINEGCAPQPNLLWDTNWDASSGVGDWALAGPTETLNRGGLQAVASLETAVILCLFTDRYCPPTHPLAKYIEGGDPRGYWGDGIDVREDLGEAPMGSLLWLLERAVVTDNTVQWAQSLALDALAPMLAQQSIANVAATAMRGATPNRIDLLVQIYGQDGATIYNRRFDDIWKQFAHQPIITTPTIPAADLFTRLRTGNPVDLGSVTAAPELFDDLGPVNGQISDALDLGSAS